MSAYSILLSTPQYTKTTPLRAVAGLFIASRLRAIPEETCPVLP